MQIAILLLSLEQSPFRLYDATLPNATGDFTSKLSFQAFVAQSGIYPLKFFGLIFCDDHFLSLFHLSCACCRYTNAAYKMLAILHVVSLNWLAVKAIFTQFYSYGFRRSNSNCVKDFGYSFWQLYFLKKIN